MNTSKKNRKVALLGAAGLIAAFLIGFSIHGIFAASNITVHHTTGAVIQAVGAENEYADVIAQIGGRYVQVIGVMNNPNTDPHTYEASPQTANAVASANLVVQNGLGYDSFMNKLEAASPNTARKVIDVQTVLGYAATTPNPHLWYNPTTMPRLAAVIARDLSQLKPSQTQYFYKREKAFIASLQPWYRAMAQVKKEFAHAPVAVTEPIADYMLQACGLNIKTSWAFQSAVMNGTDPSPQDVQLEQNLFQRHAVRVFIYNQQVVDSMTTSLLQMAQENHIPIVGVYETMPANRDYQTWMLNEVQALQTALAHHVSTERMS